MESPTSALRTQYRNLFDQVQAMAVGAVLYVDSSQTAELGKRELASIRSWVNWERRRMKKENLADIESGLLPASSLDQVDPLEGVSMYLLPQGAGWRLVFHRPAPPVLKEG